MNEKGLALGNAKRLAKFGDCIISPPPFRIPWMSRRPTDALGGDDGGGEDESELFEAGEMIDGKYEVVRRLGRGGYGPLPCPHI